MTELQRARLNKRLEDGELVRRRDGNIVCAFCGGNCGQCGVTDLIGSPPPSLQQMAHNLHRGNAPGLPRLGLFSRVMNILKLT